MTNMSPSDQRRALSAPFHDVSWRPTSINDSICLFTPYVDVDASRRRLDQVFGRGQWSARFRVSPVPAARGSAGRALVDCLLFLPSIGRYQGASQIRESSNLNAAKVDAFQQAILKAGLGRLRQIAVCMNPLGQPRCLPTIPRDAAVPAALQLPGAKQFSNVGPSAAELQLDLNRLREEVGESLFGEVRRDLLSRTGSETRDKTGASVVRRK